jgi:hypothetical protein
MSGKRVKNRSKVLALFLTAVLLLPVYGSWIDFHYAAKQPGHKHVYLGKVDLNHHRTADTKDIVILPDQDATSQIVVLVNLPEKIASTADRDSLSFGLAHEYRSPENAFLPPPDHPPRI